MENEIEKYYCDDSLNSERNWNYLMDYAFKNSDQVEFNILFSSNKLAPEIQALSNDLLEKNKTKNKVYPSGYFLKYKLSDQVKEFIKSKNYKDWYNYQLEDISFLKDGKEFLATVTHENQIIIKMSEAKREKFNKMGFDFEFDWGIDPAGEHANRKSLITRILDRFK